MLDTAPRAAVQVYQELRDDIISLRMEPGSLISRPKLAVRFGVSSTPIRDALIRLSEEGLVEIFAQSATRVSRIDLAKAREAQFLRRALEQEAMETLCAAPDPQGLQELKTLLAHQKHAAKLNDMRAFDQLDRDFHRTILTLAGVPALYGLVRRYSTHIERLRQLHLPLKGRMQEILRDHARILAAIAERNPAEGRLAIRDHLSSSLAYSDQLRASHPAYFRD
jgi:DNA-binding GntR family transcriptional regulator